MARALIALSVSAALLVPGAALAESQSNHTISDRDKKSFGEIFAPKLCKLPCGGLVDVNTRRITCLCVA